MLDKSRDNDPLKKNNLEENTLSEKLFQIYHQGIANLPESVSEEMNSLFSSENIFPGPSASSLLDYFSALLKAQASRLLENAATEALRLGTLPDLFANLLDRDRMFLIAYDLIWKAAQQSFWHGNSHAYFCVYAESDELLEKLHPFEKFDSFWGHDPDNDEFADELRKVLPTIREESNRARKFNSVRCISDLDDLRTIFGDDSTLTNFLATQKDSYTVYLLPLRYGDQFFGNVIYAHSGSQNQATTLGKDLSAIGHALSIGLKRISDIGGRALRP